MAPWNGPNNLRKTFTAITVVNTQHYLGSEQLKCAKYVRKQHKRLKRSNSGVILCHCYIRFAIESESRFTMYPNPDSLNRMWP